MDTSHQDLAGLAVMSHGRFLSREVPDDKVMEGNELDTGVQ